jgi:hypothetical protein
MIEKRQLKRRFLSLAIIGIAASAGAQLPVRPTALLPATARTEVVFTDIGLAYPASDPRDGLDIQPWVEGGVAVGETIGERLDYFTVVPSTIRLAVGRRLEFANMQITTHGLHGDPVLRAPLKLSIEAPAGLLDIESAVGDHTLIGLSPGIGRLWIESQLPRGTGTGERYRLPVPIVIR